MTVGDLRDLLGFFKQSEQVTITSVDGPEYGWIDIGEDYRNPIAQITNRGVVV